MRISELGGLQYLGLTKYGGGGGAEAGGADTETATAAAASAATSTANSALTAVQQAQAAVTAAQAAVTAATLAVTRAPPVGKAAARAALVTAQSNLVRAQTALTSAQTRYNAALAALQAARQRDNAARTAAGTFKGPRISIKSGGIIKAQPSGAAPTNPAGSGMETFDPAGIGTRGSGGSSGSGSSGGGGGVTSCFPGQHVNAAGTACVADEPAPRNTRGNTQRTPPAGSSGGPAYGTPEWYAAGGSAGSARPPPVVTVVNCAAGTKLDPTGKFCIKPDAGTPVPDTGGGVINEEQATGCPPGSHAIEYNGQKMCAVDVGVTTPDSHTSGGGGGGGGGGGAGGGGGGNMTGDGDVPKAYAPPSDFVAPTVSVTDPSLEKRVNGEDMVAPGTKASTGSRTALYVGGALAIFGVGYLAYKKSKSSGART